MPVIIDRRTEPNPDLVTVEETTDERRLRHDERRRIRAAIPQRAGLERELQSLRETEAAHIREAESAVVRTSTEVERLRSELESATGDDRDRLVRELHDATRTFEAAKARVQPLKVPNKWGGISEFDNRVPEDLRNRIRSATDRLAEFPTEADLGRAGAGEPMLVAKCEAAAVLIQNLQTYLRDARKLVAMAIDRNVWDRAAVTTWRRQKRQAIAKIEVVEAFIDDLQRQRDSWILEMVNEQED